MQRLRGLKILLLVCIFFVRMDISAQVSAEQVMQIGRNVLSMEDYMLAIQYFNQAIKAKPYLSDPYYYRALAKLSLEDYRGAEEDCTLAIERNKFKSEAYKLRGLARQYLDRNHEAVEDYDAGLKYYPFDKWFLYYKGVALSEMKEYEKADSTFDRLLTTYPGFDDGYTARARSMALRGDTVAAMSDLDKAIEISSLHTGARLQRAELRSRLKLWKEATEDLDAALRITPLEADLYVNRAFTRYNSDDWFGAMADYNHAIELEPDNTAALFNRALLRYETRDLTRAAEDLTSVLDLDPDNFHARYNRGLVELEKGDYKKAIADFNRVAKRFPRYYVVYYAIAEAKRQSGDLKGASQYARKADQMVAGYVADPVKNPLDKPAVASGKGNDGSVGENESETEVMERFNQLVTVSSSSGERLAYNERSKGKVQNRTTRTEPLPQYLISFAFTPTELKGNTNYFRELDNLNQRRLTRYNLYLLPENALPGDSVSISGWFDVEHDITSKIERTGKARPADLLVRGVAYVLLKNHRAAIADLTEALTVDSSLAPAYFARACANYGLANSMADESSDYPAIANGYLQAAVADFMKALQLNPNLSYAPFNIGVITLESQQYQLAIQYFDQAIKADPKFGDAYFNRAIAYLGMGSKPKALADLRTAGELGILQAYSLLKRMQ